MNEILQGTITRLPHPETQRDLKQLMDCILNEPYDRIRQELLDTEPAYAEVERTLLHATYTFDASQDEHPLPGELSGAAAEFVSFFNRIIAPARRSGPDDIAEQAADLTGAARRELSSTFVPAH